MYYYKYFRNDVYFDKSIRYNELFFASNQLLNDPMDLAFDPVLIASTDEWRTLFENTPTSLNDSVIMHLQQISNNLTLSAVLNNAGEFLSKIHDLFLSQNVCGTSIQTEGVINGFYNKIHEASFLKPVSTSFSKTPLSTLMWAYYANGFNGCALIYDGGINNDIELSHYINDQDYTNYNFVDVEYGSIPSISICELLDGKLTKNKLAIKTKSWAHEHESRLISFIYKERDGIVLHHRQSALKGVVFGASCGGGYIEKITEAIRLNKKHNGGGDFYTFQTELRPDTGITITSARHIKEELKSSSQNALSPKELTEWESIFRSDVS
ncbi:DUF2971 domain-containing protein [Edwardsiella tarda]|uniref:DUF2971 domain-containing protein n=1 Tax=Edwardsiella tarda TaxID=636 RepID=UPI003B513F03